MGHPLLNHPFIAEQIEDAVAPFIGRVTDEDLQWMREQLAAHLEDSPRAAKLVKGAYPRMVDTSGEQRSPLVDESSDRLEISGSEE